MSRKNKINIYIFLRIVFLLTFLIYKLENSNNYTFRNFCNNKGNLGERKYFKNSRLMNETEHIYVHQYTAVKSEESDNNNTLYCKGKNESFLKTLLEEYQQADKEDQCADLSDKGVLLDLMNKILLKEKLLNPSFSNIKSVKFVPYKNSYMDDLEGINRIKDLSEKSKLYRSPCLRMKYKFYRCFRKFFRKIRKILIFLYKVNKHVIKNISKGL
ncbi:Plasmodium exported protein, unknown function [Plasmodium malariae]|uniref:Uncharacterized protein n=3 Tax=Plasmodium (Plasmodium) TaxID=418103 RepID=A0A1D3JM29_PLAMA|nr:Plasmodium exported protein, unknown function [Plasmodium malariae]SBT87680.1 Plasmodium exported protein, unknown function [Plasmodium malariae]